MSATPSGPLAKKVIAYLEEHLELAGQAGEGDDTQLLYDGRDAARLIEAALASYEPLAGDVMAGQLRAAGVTPAFRAACAADRFDSAALRDAMLELADGLEQLTGVRSFRALAEGSKAW